jgi:hypothetical protein
MLLYIRVAIDCITVTSQRPHEKREIPAFILVFLNQTTACSQKVIEGREAPLRNHYHFYQDHISPFANGASCIGTHGGSGGRYGFSFAPLKEKKA